MKSRRERRSLKEYCGETKKKEGNQKMCVQKLKEGRFFPKTKVLGGQQGQILPRDYIGEVLVILTRLGAEEIAAKFQ